MRARLGYGLIGAAVWLRRLYTLVAVLLALTVVISAVAWLFDDESWLPPYGTNGQYAWQMALIVIGLLVVGRAVVFAMVRAGVAVLPPSLQGMPRRRRRRRPQGDGRAGGPLALELGAIRESMDPRSAAQPGHRGLMIFCLGVLVLILAAQGVTSRTIGASRTPGEEMSSVAPVGDQRPLLTVDGHGLRSHQPPEGKRLALTFDDGPDATWTPAVMATLRRYHVPATFFVVGGRVVRYPGLVREERKNGFEIGNHTFTHADLSTLPGWEANAQVALAESAIMGVTGIRPRLFRPPYSATSDAITPHQETVLGKVAAQGYIVAVADIDPEDWSRPGVQTIVSRVMAGGGDLHHAVHRPVGDPAVAPGVHPRPPARPQSARAAGRPLLHPAGVDHRARLQRGGGDRARRALAGRVRLPRVRGGGGRRRLRRRHGRHRRARPDPQRPAPAPGQRGQAQGAQQRHRARQVRHRGHRRRRHRLRARDAAAPGPAVPVRERGRGVGQHQDRQPQGPAGEVAAHRVRDGLQPRPAHVRGARLHAHRAGRDRRLPQAGAARRGRGLYGHPGRGHRRHDGHRSRRLAHGVRAGRAGVDRGPGDAGAAVAPALPLGLRDDPVGVQAPQGDLRQGG